MFLFEKSIYLKKIQKKNILDKGVKWIDNFDKLKKGPIIFFGNEFFDALPIKQFKKIYNSLYEKNYTLNQKFEIEEVFRKASQQDKKMIKILKL